MHFRHCFSFSVNGFRCLSGFFGQYLRVYIFSDRIYHFIPISLQGTSMSGGMVLKRPSTVTSSVFYDDDVSLMEMPAFPKAVPRRLAPGDYGSKKRKQTSSHSEKAKGTNQEGREKED